MDSTEQLIADLRAHLAQLPIRIPLSASSRLLSRALVELVARSHGECICKQCGLRQDAQPVERGDF